MSTREDVKTFFGLPLDFSMLELEPETDADPVRYFCTPENAEIIGWGSCGTHFVLLPGDERVFCVDPAMGEVGSYVLPVAEDFHTFLAYLLFCRDANPLSQIWWMEEKQFRDMLAENVSWEGCEEFFARKDQTLATLSRTFGLTSQDPWEMVKALQGRFDPSVLTFSPEYYNVLGLEQP